MTAEWAKVTNGLPKVLKGSLKVMNRVLKVKNRVLKVTKANWRECCNGRRPRVPEKAALQSGERLSII
jgi:hypothetical protein